MEPKSPQLYWKQRTSQHKVGPLCFFTNNQCLYFKHHIVHYAAGSDYTAVGDVRPFPINGDDRVCVEVPIIQDEIIQMEYYEVFLIQITDSDVPVIVPQAVVVILDQGKFPWCENTI